ncbi:MULTISPECIES: 3-hydroxyacyl-CoA dehydrogenase NAD-binding domain-containing protein [unclassified Sphingobium]|uniref:3-hydroxyacyl-CoA dehydrogenase NAD-binding domain-containing protein n=1 Tax=unclassified Sphingobium TaxID=2611147 RepID=UPI000D16562D|nr:MULTISPECIES: 3-hydroxyacyl-CoA dehydrogenase NAD-binding domain-containing protein [unclassified Sphingobium]MBG6120121.1 3-hydroxyacyl-CoA dehydrogenase [Sphingobium sp. JAI105]PSO12836.1 3-hydroxyacyl-CoA dehydrogenase [Sphingobium sp. AEW4]TWD05678.1 short chain enoyl-CoA hydratase /3-hydroxyacyl-CoA dehydrogenase [Sphingobium sp. AEW010]TWD23231.1 short chain enoyl-CoA hydratase /3-hydroxyacyl-CoA dehydrogenase [Sphingobium sp. AEW013]TWD25091.1 short chain enoyl-CoA hydratase /3-hydro
MTEFNSAIDYVIEDDIGIVTIDSPPVNALSVAVVEGIYDIVPIAMADPAVKAVVLICAGRTFIAGADIKNINNADAQARIDFPELQRRITGATKPLIAAIHGTALGGGLELAMNLHYRIAVPSARFGLPEVKIGLLPGGGGTQLLTRLVGAQAALDMMTTGDMIGTDEALKIGLIDALAPEGELRAAALDFAKGIIADGAPLKRIGDKDDKIAIDRANPGLYDAYRKANAKRLRNLDAPERIIRCVEVAVNAPSCAEGLLEEREIFLPLRGSAQNKALLHNFFAEREAAKVADLPKDTPVLPVESVGVIGAGTMGRGIALAFLNAGLSVTLVEADAGALDKAVGMMRSSYDGQLKRGKITQDAVDAAMGKLSPTADIGAVAEVDLVIEAIYEDMAVKKELMAKLDAIAKPDAILATNTSYLDVNEIAAATARPDKVLGMHFFSPANIMRLLEVVRGDKTSKEVIATVMKLAVRLKKVPVLAGVCFGFIGNRMLRVRRDCAENLALEGADPARVDKILYNFGFPMGPFAMQDMAGLDVGWSRDTSTGSTTKELMCEAGRRGQKDQAGYYDYDDKRNATPSPVALGIIRGLAERKGVARREFSDEEILEILLFPMINEGAKILEEGIAQRSSDIDATWINGYGFPAYRGGPMYWADQIGLDRVLRRMEELEGRYGAWLAPAAALRRLVAEGRTFGQAYP